MFGEFFMIGLRFYEPDDKTGYESEEATHQHKRPQIDAAEKHLCQDFAVRFLDGEIKRAGYAVHWQKMVAVNFVDIRATDDGKYDVR